MLRAIETLNFRCLRYVRQPLGPFHVLIGPNASGKTTFLDVVAFLGRLVSDGVEAAVEAKSRNFQDLVWGGRGSELELAVEAAIPEERRNRLKKKEFDTIRYEVRIGLMPEASEVGILEERALLKTWKADRPGPRTLFPMDCEPPRSILGGRAKSGERTILSKGPKGNDNFYSEVVEESGKGWYPSIRLGARKSALGNLHEDESRFPVATWLKNHLVRGVQSFLLNSLLIRKASPPGQVHGFKPDGSNVPWVIADLRRVSGERFEEWIRHIRTALPDIEDIRTVEREDDKHRYLKICYRGGLEVPSWMASDGTLRLLALTLPAYLPGFKGVYLVEEPENGVHPSAVQTVFQSLSSVYDAQMLLATHSPVILSLAGPEDILCFKKTETGATDIVLGSEHPALRGWKGQMNLSVLFASGVL
ncbi:MAG: AAA family ATPase [Planctomycetes bacterium]|nr:AAA family ATPase [Planctomycetota bacterium]